MICLKRDLVLFFIFLFFLSCQEKLPRIVLISTKNIEEININSAIALGEIMDIGEGIIEHGHCWDIDSKPNLETGARTTLGRKGDKGVFQSNLENLEAETNYYYRAYASDGNNIVYGEILSFRTTDKTVPVVTTGLIRSITTSVATIEGEVISLGDGVNSLIQHGHCWSMSNPPVYSGEKTELGPLSSPGIFSSTITGLSDSTTYYVRAYAANEKGIVYGSTVPLTTYSSLVVFTNQIDMTSKEDTVLAYGSIVYFGYNESSVSQHGHCWATHADPTPDDNKSELGYNDSGGLFFSTITGLIPDIEYFIRSYAINSNGISYGENKYMYKVDFDSTMTDPRDGQVYKTVIIGTQTWMAENLNYGTRINGVLNQTDNGVTEKYCYDDNPLNCEQYGGLYQWDEAMQYVTTEGTQGVCPDGWHIPTDNEWITLELYLGMSPSQIAIGTGYRGTDEGTQLKVNGNTGFNALPSGDRYHVDGNFYHIGEIGYLYCSTPHPSAGIFIRAFNIDEAGIYRGGHDPNKGYSIRCIED